MTQENDPQRPTQIKKRPTVPVVSSYKPRNAHGSEKTVEQKQTQISLVTDFFKFFFFLQTDHVDHLSLLS